MSMRESSKKAAKTTGAWLFLAPSLLGVLVFVMIPFGDALRRSFFDSRGIDFVGLGVYRGVLANQAFRLAAVNTVRFMGTALPLLMEVSFSCPCWFTSTAGKRVFLKQSWSCRSQCRQRPLFFCGGWYSANREL